MKITPERSEIDTHAFAVGAEMPILEHIKNLLFQMALNLHPSTSQLRAK